MAAREYGTRGVLRQRVMPSLAVVAAVLVAAMPWGLGGNATFALPLVTVAVIFILSAEEQPLLPTWLVFAAGLVSDLLTAGPLGYWAIIHLLTYSLARVLSFETRHWQWPVLWICFAISVAFVAVAGWALASLYFVRPIDWHPIAFGAVVAAGVFPVLFLVLTRLLQLGRRHWSPV